MCWIVFGLAHVCGDCVPVRREVGRMSYGMSLFSLIVDIHFAWLYGSFLSYCWPPCFVDIWFFSLLLSASVALCPPYAVVITNCS